MATSLVARVKGYLKNLAPMTDGQLMIGDTADIPAPKTISGAFTLAKTGVATLSDASVTAAKMPLFVSTEQTGTGSAQNVAHGLGAVPSKVLIVPTELAADLAAGYDAAEGTHTTTNVVVTVTSGAKFKVWALV